MCVCVCVCVSVCVCVFAFVCVCVYVCACIIHFKIESGVSAESTYGAVEAWDSKFSKDCITGEISQEPIQLVSVR